MAHAKKLVQKVPVTTYKQVENGIELQLDKYEVKFLYSLLSRIGGDPNKSFRGCRDSIARAMEDAYGHTGYDEWPELYDPEIVSTMTKPSVTSNTVFPTRPGINFEDR